METELMKRGRKFATRRLAPFSVLALVLAAWPAAGPAAHRLAAPGVTSLTNPKVEFQVADQHHVVLKNGDITAIIVDNAAVNDGQLQAAHRAGYNGLAQLGHRRRKQNLFRAPYAGINFEHIHDGTLAVAREKFEPRVVPMQLRVIDSSTVELYQRPTVNWKLESCGRYRLLPDGTIEYTFECIPRARTFHQGFIGLFWASYIDGPEDKAIHFRGRRSAARSGTKWVKSLPPAHGTNSTHPPVGGRLPTIVKDFPLTLVNHPSEYVHAEPWFFGVSHGMAFAQIFRARDGIWIAQSPTGAGATNPAWDFQWFVPGYKVDEAYGFVMRAIYIPYKSRRQVARAVRPHLDALNPSPAPRRRRAPRSR
ncbi:MAG: hypothetical protein CMJ65_15325 [Planctomycetaceae bacterium]|jgi:hypothetical protein|nr:hypothetical protein [Planctomycetaceae bacterium]